MIIFWDSLIRVTYVLTSIKRLKLSTSLVSAIFYPGFIFQFSLLTVAISLAA